jgi:cystathionine beta-lyase
MSIQYNFDQIIDRQNSDCIKWHFYQEEILPMWVADMDFRSPEPVIRALRERVDHGVFGYPELHTRHTNLMLDFNNVLVDRMETNYGWSITPEDIFFLPGVVTGFNLACHAFAASEGAVFVQTPVYHPILDAGNETGSLSQEMELSLEPNGSYSVDWDLFKEKIDAQTRLFILCNPHNPIGKVFSKDELLRTAEICLEKGIIICSDEIHCDILFDDNKHIPIASLDPEIAQNTITLMAPSKTFNLAGLQCSFAIIQNPDLRRKYLSARKGLVPWVNLMGLQAALAAYQEGNEWFLQLMEYLKGNRDFLIQFAQENFPGIKLGTPQGTYLAWLDCRETGIGASPYQFFHNKASVGLNDGASFGQGGQGFVRLNFGCPRSLLSTGLERMYRALANIHHQE